MISRLVKKIFGKSEDKPGGAAKFGIKLREKSSKLLEFAGKNFELVKNEITIIRAKCQNLREVNYNLGLKHLENGHLSDAIFRFRFIKKFWPDLYDAYYQLAYCLILDNESQKAKEVLRELLIKKPDYDPRARELLDHINATIQKSLSE
ncbi:MAG: hypothetical protein A2887_05085 [Alphaproteobacteria bacterium RIFCSPLOWO2_01_FULL_40_26]|nr:MAG: hypothetical protein A3D15_03605 [Alphaproteobacteria bacterium RIFCSPHIGHO2_02_FULL_40_34]OFW88365.1 MAG: hypothetical protein A2794_02440 [Alphaproteobacteria bacterium RIFCSPHIGHO2_01_FULL_40_8]OFW94309.1 MAG: hypothetical protein A2887_05085 [Alphaproteobacteria bacterium RIFCSPLOWO2_01_FULL_40_26]OFX09994.1 MAG: hypothetical protein A3H30_02875 [Alphaproteobacteria bacterium RIFCSPLOWO2_02_FULL_40_19]OFX11073.1 MAG: hypothetical protein A3G22_05780 [Alphaproteobacteria bacterium RI